MKKEAEKSKKQAKNLKKLANLKTLVVLFNRNKQNGGKKNKSDSSAKEQT